MFTQLLASMTAINPILEVTPHSVRAKICVLLRRPSEERQHG